jgi:hypothetical protein
MEAGEAATMIDFRKYGLTEGNRSSLRSEMIKQWLRGNDRVQVVFRGKPVAGRVITAMKNEVLIEMRIGSLLIVRRFPYNRIKRFLP